MLEQGRISCTQTVFMLMNSVVVTAVVFLPVVTNQIAGRDAWMTQVMATLPGIFLAFLIAVLGKRFPGQTLVQYLQTILGSWLGKFVAILYVFFFIHTNGNIVREYGDLLKTLILPETPLVVLHVIMLMLCAWAVRGGLELLSRTIQLIYPSMMVVFMLILIFLGTSMNLNYLLPLLENGVMPVIKASIIPTAWRGEIILLAMFLPYMATPRKAGFCGMLAVIGIGLVLMADSVVNTAVFGPALSRLSFPTFSLARELGTIDAIIVSAWIFGIFGKIVMFYYVSVMAIAQLVNLKDYRPVILPVGVITAMFSIYAVENIVRLTEYVAEGFPVFAITFEFIIPTALLLIAMVRGLKGCTEK